MQIQEVLFFFSKMESTHMHNIRWQVENSRWSESCRFPGYNHAGYVYCRLMLHPHKCDVGICGWTASSIRRKSECKLDLSKYRGKGYKVLVYRNNQIEELEIDKQMIASKDVEEMVPFAVLAEKSEISKAVDHIKDTVKTGDNSSVLLLLCIVVVAGSVAGGVIYWRKKKAKR